MSEAIKLFGKTISLPPLYHLSYSNDSCFEATGDDFSYKTTSSLNSAREQQGQEINRESSGKEITDDKQEVSTSNQETEDSKDPTTTTTSSSGINEKPKTSSADRETSPSKEISKNGEEEEKTLKKPDKILPCPRCKSMDTKFCYFNNYNVNQPRHFCKNCQRYWTAGGTMRNVPVGAGRRKNKSSPASHYRHIIVSDSLRTSQVHAVNSSTVLSFGADSPLCESVTSVLNFSEKNGYHRTEQRLNVSCGRKADDKDDRSSGNSVTTSQETVTKNYHQGVCPQVQYFPGSPWPYPWNSTMPSGFPVSFYPYWGCTVPHPWNVPPCLSPTSPLGKHSREVANSEEPSRETNCSERSVSARKALRIDDPTEAAKSSMWATLGIKTEKSNLNNGGGIFNGFQLKHHENINYTSEIQSSVLQANPAALSRSLKFHEST